jgi:transcriptional regulator with XRE-family HTH domain
MDINLRIKEIRLVLGESKISFSKKLNIDNSQYGKIESGKLAPTLGFLLELFSNYEDVSPDWIMTGNGNRFRDKSISSNSCQKEIEILEKLLSEKENRIELLNIIMQKQEKEIAFLSKSVPKGTKVTGHIS